MKSYEEIRRIVNDITNAHPSWTDAVLTDKVIEYIRRDAVGIETEEDIRLRREALKRYEF